MYRRWKVTGEILKISVDNREKTVYHREWKLPMGRLYMLHLSYDNRFTGFTGFGYYFSRNAFGCLKIEHALS